VSDLRLGLKLLWRAARAGELSLLAVAIVLAVASMATVSLFTERMRLGLENESGQLLGGDLVITSTRPVSADLRAGAETLGLRAITTLGFRSMVTAQDQSVLAEVVAVDEGYPLRGTTRIAPGRGATDRPAGRIPPDGSIFADERLLVQLGARVGDIITLGERRLRIDAMLTQDPSLSLSAIGLGPRIVMAAADLASTRLIQPGSRVQYRLLVAGERSAVDRFRELTAAALQQGQRVEGVRDARPEIRSALERAERFMRLAALTAVALAAVAVLLAARRFHERQLDACALLRCLGSSQMRVFRLQCIQLAGVGVLASALGCLLGYATQALLGHWLANVIGIGLPPPGVIPTVQAASLGMVLVLAFGLPPLLALRYVSALRVLRRDIGRPGASSILAYGFGIATIAALVFWHADDPRLGGYFLIGSLGVVGAAALVTTIGLRILSALRSGVGVSWRYGVANLRRRAAATSWQVMALALGMTALLTLTLVRADLVRTWQRSLPQDAPNRFLVNIRPDQAADLAQFLRSEELVAPPMYPMVRGRLIAVNGRPIVSESYADDRARRLVEREFNLSWAPSLPRDNVVVRGSWWNGIQWDPGQLSVEEGIARTLGLRLGDVLTYDVAGSTFEARISNLRRVTWDNFRVNFFVIAAPGLLEEFPATYIASFHLPADKLDVLGALIRQFPTVVVIDVAAVLNQVQSMIVQVSRAIQFVFLFTLVAGLLVLYAGIAATHDERVREVAIMRTLGASRNQVGRAQSAEFAIVGALAGVLAAAAASALGYFIGVRLLDLPYRPDPLVWLIGVGAGITAVTIVGMLFTRRILATPPLTSLRQVD
jgi:putative ABC transport system permease protein